MTANQIFKVTLLGKSSLVTSTAKQLRDLDMDIIRAQREAGRDLQSCHGITYELVSTDTVRSFKEGALKRLAVEHADKPNDKRDTDRAKGIDMLRNTEPPIASFGVSGSIFSPR